MSPFTGLGNADRDGHGEGERGAALPVDHLEMPGGIYAATATLAALRERDATGRCGHIHVSMVDVLVEWMSQGISKWPRIEPECHGGT